MKETNKCVKTEKIFKFLQTKIVIITRENGYYTVSQEEKHSYENQTGMQER